MRGEHGRRERAREHGPGRRADTPDGLTAELLRRAHRVGPTAPGSPPESAGSREHGGW
ncbi:hypothetical protein [Kitasatospora phosalacinea]|uniref:hypothetical protein n=1 Tax=Kitasatospora phosalacinea TaxID=2065 RepID=UPI000B1D1C1E|nr:hypothetical protein [Kitasatospora phosalacinea]